MFCQNCGTDVTNMKYCPKCGKAVNTKTAMPKNPRNWKPLTDKDYLVNYVAFCFLSTLWLTVYGLLHTFNAVERYNGKGLEYITNRAMPQLLGAFIGIALVCAYTVYKTKTKISARKAITAILTFIVSQIFGIIIMFFMYVGAPALSDIELFEWAKIRLVIILVIISIIYASFLYVAYTQKKSGIRNKQQELPSSVLLSAIFATIETFLIWKVVL